MIDLESLYFDWLMSKFDPKGVTWGIANLSHMLHDIVFERRVGNDINRATDGINLRRAFLTDFDDVRMSPRMSNDLMDMECSWLEMLIALADALDYRYDGGVELRFIEMVENAGLGPVLSAVEYDDEDRDLVEEVCDRIDRNHFDYDGRGGLFPLSKPGHLDQRRVEIWMQHAAYFREKLEGVMWTSTS